MASHSSIQRNPQESDTGNPNEVRTKFRSVISRRRNRPVAGIPPRGYGSTSFDNDEWSTAAAVSSRRPSRRSLTLRRVAFAAACVVVAAASAPALHVDYLLTQAVYQGGMLAHRTPVDEVLEAGTLPWRQQARLELVEEIRRFGIEEIGLAQLESYTTVAAGFDRQMFNVMACETDRFQPVEYWFPITGRIPYLGYFRIADAQREVLRLRRAGLDVSARPVGAYSSLGWFDDPILPGMLTWSEHHLANTLLHESAHATLFLPGQMRFNESFARFVGDVASGRFMEFRRTEDVVQYWLYLDVTHDDVLLKELLAEIYADLDDLYRSGATHEEILQQKRELLEAAGETCRGMPFRLDGFRAYFERREVNNATLMTFRTYNTGDEAFEVLLEQCDGDLRCMIDTLEVLHQVDEDPWTWLADRTGIEEIRPSKGP